MNDFLSTNQIKKRSVSGAKWLFLMNGLGVPAAILTAIMLGRVGPNALGLYAIVQILIGIITTFIVYGGQPVLPVFMPKLSNPDDRGRFFFCYLVILLTAMVLMLCFFYLSPNTFSFLLQRKFDMHNYGWFIALAIIIVAAEAFTNAASSLMLIKITAIARQIMRMVLLPLVAVLFFWKRDILLNHGLEFIWGGFCAGYLIAAAISSIAVVREPRLNFKIGFLIPSGLWTFSLTSMAGSILSFFYANFDRMAILSIQDVEGLGMYQAMFSINSFMELLPAIVRSSVVSVFANLNKGRRQEAFQRAFHIVCRWNVLLVTTVSLIVMGFSREILSLFGPKYMSYANLLVLFGLANIIRSMSVPNFSVLLTLEKNTFRFFNSIITVLSQCVLTFVFISDYGVLAIAGSKLICISVSSLVSTFYVIYSIGMVRTIPLIYKVAVVTGLIMTIFHILVLPAGWLSATGLTSICIAVFLVLSRFSLREIQKITKSYFSA